MSFSQLASERRQDNLSLSFAIVASPPPASHACWRWCLFEETARLRMMWFQLFVACAAADQSNLTDGMSTQPYRTLVVDKPPRMVVGSRDVGQG